MIPFLNGIRHAIYNLNKRVDLLTELIRDMFGIESSSILSLINILNDKDASTGILNTLVGKADKTEIPKNTSDLTNDSGFITVDDDGHLQINELNVTIISNLPFPSTWPTTNLYTLLNLVDAIDADPDAVKGKTYMSTVHYSDLNSAVGLYDGELKVEIMESSDSHKIARFTISSANKSPYYWLNTMWNGSLNNISNVPGLKWVSFVPSVSFSSLSAVSGGTALSAVTTGEKYIWNNKADKLPMIGEGAATENNLMAIDANGNIKDSGKKASDFQATLVVGTNLDSTPTANSTNPVTSVGIKAYVDPSLDVPIPFESESVRKALASAMGQTFRDEVTFREAASKTKDNQWEFAILTSSGATGTFNEFKYFRNVTKTVIGNGHKLTSIVFPEGFTTFGTNDCRQHSSMSGVYYELPSTTQIIASYTFYNTPTTVKIWATTPPTLNANNTNVVKVYVPSSAVDTYKSAAGWSALASKIEGF